jgi:hypothetical protein
MPHNLLAALRASAGKRKLPYQRLMKLLLAEALGLIDPEISANTTRRYKAPHLDAAISRLKKR